MAYQAAEKFGNQGESIYGDTWVASDGDGDNLNELWVGPELENTGQMRDIMVMRSEIMQCPQTGDEYVLELLDFEQVIVESGQDFNYEMITQTYPDLPEVLEFMRQVADTDSDVKAMICAVTESDEPTVEQLEHLSADKMTRALHAVLDGVTARQEEIVLLSAIK